MPIHEPSRAGMRSTWVQAAAWLTAASLAVLSWAPPHWRLVTGAPRALEHIVAFTLAGLLFAAAYPRGRWRVLAVGVAAIGMVEVVQAFAPGRHAYASDFVVNAVAFAAGLACIATWRRSDSGNLAGR